MSMAAMSRNLEDCMYQIEPEAEEDDDDYFIESPPTAIDMHSARAEEELEAQDCEDEDDGNHWETASTTSSHFSSQVSELGDTVMMNDAYMPLCDAAALVPNQAHTATFSSSSSLFVNDRLLSAQLDLIAASYSTPFPPLDSPAVQFAIDYCRQWWDHDDCVLGSQLLSDMIWGVSPASYFSQPQKQ